jgi:hypothetical protein
VSDPARGPPARSLPMACELRFPLVFEALPDVALVVFPFRFCGNEFAKTPLHRCSDSHPGRDGLVVFP